MTQIGSRIQRKIERIFPPDKWSEVRLILQEECGTNLPLVDKQGEAGIERIRAAVLRLSNGRIPDLKRHVENAKRDWRDVLVAAEFGNDPTAHLNWLDLNHEDLH